ncbi:MAG TPA: SAM-dependent methyltransferase [Streptosporangiaceae bacterium]|nr:SAM-dependent methyltransferase [Streptosporangiaceae bacterium]
MTQRIKTSDLRTHIPHPARVYDYWLGGKDNFAADREVAEKTLVVAPETARSARSNRAFLRRAVRLAAEAGIRQFLDIGSGLPTMDNTHEVAHETAATARVVYVDNDPIVSAHGRALLTDAGSTTVVQADLRDPDSILRHDEVRRLLDLGRPVALLLLGILHFIPDEDGPYEIVTRLRAAMVPGSYLIFSHLTGDADPIKAEEAMDVWRQSPGTPPTLRDRAQVERFFDGFDILEPGIVPPDRWRPEPDTEAPERYWLWAGVGIKK